MNRTADLSYWINERYAIKMRREQGIPPPWTGNPVMATTRFCNVHREDDKVTRWLAENWRPKYQEVWQYLLARLINNIPTLQIIHPHPSNLGEIKRALKIRRQVAPIFGNAYTVSTSGVSMDKVDYIIDRVVVPAMAADFMVIPWRPGLHLETACNDLCRLNGVSTFMAGQLIADMKNTPGHPLESAPDRATWAAPGPGSLRGLTAYFNRPITPSMFDTHIRICKEEVTPLIADYVPPIDMQDFQNCLCEFSKYIRVGNGGHTRNRYHPAP